MQCRATNKAGQPCRAKAMGNGFCYRHNPDISHEEKLMASSRGGKKIDSTAMSATAETIILEDLPDMLTALTNNVNDLRCGYIDVRTSNAVVQHILAAIEIYKTASLQARLNTLEQKLNRIKMK